MMDSFCADLQKMVPRLHEAAGHGGATRVLEVCASREVNNKSGTAVLRHIVACSVIDPPYEMMRF